MRTRSDHRIQGARLRQRASTRVVQDDAFLDDVAEEELPNTHLRGRKSKSCTNKLTGVRPAMGRTFLVMRFQSASSSATSSLATTTSRS